METYCATGFFETLFLGFWVDGEKDKSDVFIIRDGIKMGLMKSADNETGAARLCLFWSLVQKN